MDLGDNCPEQHAAGRTQPQKLIPGSAPRHLAYSPYGYLSIFQAVLGFNGGRQDPVTGCYLLGNGRRAFNPSLMRFISPDSMSPFAAGGLNSYVYCLGDPVNREDPSGYFSLIKPISRLFRYFFPKKKPTTSGKLHRAIVVETEVITKTYSDIPSDTKIKVVKSPKSVPNGYVLRIVHGTQEEHVQSLLSGLDPGYKKNGSYGAYVYGTTNIDAASNYTGQDGSIVGFYVHESESWVRGKDYWYVHKNAIAIDKSAYHKVHVSEEVVFPFLISKTLKVRWG
ncbi:RHS repeat-associated core domain-containing protein [Pseudomonas putida]|uniref:RHS repeat-associated core domain-containing protein n=1 Tax=Pseudomonas putida TaxID=303 RepID=UPI00159E37DA|nr:RHS repeat-associated core domain-containing protein [Pseudomonas putida]NVN62761.1 RHS repeat-associated core domain-containing protein [Pseudomonas putida]NVN67609.1 RHS repeat-associated core domain-containing protein [Pseudomonas putida]